MGKIRRGNYIFITWKGDHTPKHVHVFKDNRKICKWDLERNVVMEGKITKEIRNHISRLVKEGDL